MIGDIDKKFWNEGKTIIGFDEAGRGPIAGDMFFSLVELNPQQDLPFLLKDSKKYKNKQRKDIENKINDLNIINTLYVGKVSVQEINSGENLNTLLHKAISNAISEVYGDFNNNCVLFVDGNQEIKTIDRKYQYILPKLDELSWSCAIASIFAKNAQVKSMEELDKSYTQYGFKKHCGYGTKDHFDAIRKYGISEVHRKNWIKL